MTVTINNAQHELDGNATVAQVIRELSPFLGEPVMVLLNGEPVESDADVPLRHLDSLMVYPRLIGG